MKERSRISDFLTFLSTVRGDLSNITAPPSFLAPLSVVELPSFWMERPTLFTAPAAEPDPQKRALLVLKWVLCSLRSQFYIGQDVSAGLRKPLNAFLGELFFGQWTDDFSTTKIISEQVSHHPPITACYMWDDEHGIRGDGYTRVELNFSGSLNIKQTGHAIVHFDRFDEDYLIPFPNFKVKGFLSGALYPECDGTYHIISSSGFVSEIDFSGKGYFSGVKNSFAAKLYQSGDESKSAIYTASGQWSDKFTINDAKTGTIIETCIPGLIPAASLVIPDAAHQDPWESHNAWGNVLTALEESDMQKIVKEKLKLEEGQRAMRKREIDLSIEWEPKFFTSTDDDPLFNKLASTTGWRLQADRTRGVWRFDQKKAAQAVKPYHGDLTPFG